MSSVKRVPEPQAPPPYSTDYEAFEAQHKAEEEAQAKERRMQETLLSIKSKFGKNSILRGLNLEEGATAIERNKQIGGHKA